MKQTMRATGFLMAGLLGIGFGIVFGIVLASAQARDYKVGSIDIAEPWSRATPKGASVAAGYMKITNAGTAADRLISGSSEIAPTFEVHEMTMENGVAKMR